jgi:type IV pilus assembly protein PilB
MTRDLGQFLIDAGVVSSEDLRQARVDWQRNRRSLVESLVSLNSSSEEEIAETLAKHLDIPFLKLASISPDPRVLDMVKDTVAKKYRVFPINLEGGNLTLAMLDPLNYMAIRDLELFTGCTIRRSVATKTDILDAISQHYDFNASLEPVLANVVEELSIRTEQADSLSQKEVVDLVKESKKTPIVKMVNLMIQEAVKAKASDIHVEMVFNAVLVRIRVDGVLKEVMRIPKWVQNEVVARIKILAGLDITERRLPQDGRLTVWLSGRAVDVRVSTIPTFYGEKVVMRLLDKAQKLLTLEQVGMAEVSLNLLRSFVEKPQGIVLVTGPTGSGKTTSLYAILERIKSPGINIITIENPIEYEIRGINQIQVNEKAGLTFSTALRSVLRQDPNVILVGEIRDLETAEIAIQASLTGHLVFSTLHTNDAASSIIRLVDLGVEPYLVGSALTGILAQRLVRLNCPECRELYQPAPQTLQTLELTDNSLKFYRGKGCPNCNTTGYSGRIGVFEVMRVTPQMRELIAQNTSEAVIREAAKRAGMTTLKEGAVEKLVLGQTTPEEVLRVIQMEERPDVVCPQCKAQIQSDSVSCPNCSYSVTHPCSSCGQQIKLEWPVCPYCQASSSSEPKSETAVKIDVPGEEEKVDRKAPKILIVDDEEPIRKIVSLALRDLPSNPDILTAASGPEALQLEQKERPDVIILDIMMPGMDGFEVCKTLREDVSAAFIPIMMLTARGETESRTKAFTIGTDDYVTKPFEVEDLKARVARLLRRSYGV